MSVKALEELREIAADINASEIVDHMKLYPSCVFDGAWLDAWHAEFYRVIDRLESEIAEHYMPLPVDGNGEPIHMGDVLVPKDYGTRRREVIGANCKEFFFLDDEEGRIKKNRAHCWKHMEPRTLEDVLNEYYDQRGWDEADNCAMEAETLTAKYADEIRELMGAES